jgi:peptidoglycan/LPS O-acetylase OafA/YrhL
MREQLGGGESAVVYGALVVGVITIIIALLSLRWVEETFSRDMNFVEED